MTTLIMNGVLFAAILAWAIYAPAAMRFVVEGVIWLCATLIGLEMVSGIAIAMTNWSALGEFHRWAAHLLVMLCWTVVPASLALLARNFRERLGVSLLICLLSITAMSCAMLASLTGYLAPFDPETSAETRTRFVWLHGVVSPGLLAMIAPCWIVAIRRLRYAPSNRETAANRPTDSPPESADGNPYASPAED